MKREWNFDLSEPQRESVSKSIQHQNNTELNVNDRQTNIQQQQQQTIKMKYNNK